MRGGTRSAVLAVASLTIVIAFGGCAGSSWQFWKSSAPTQTEQAGASSTVATAAPLAPSSNDASRLPELVAVRFQSGQATVGQADVKALDGVVRWLKEHPGSVVVIEGTHRRSRDSRARTWRSVRSARRRSCDTWSRGGSSRRASRSSRMARINRCARRRPTRAGPRTGAPTCWSSGADAESGEGGGVAFGRAAAFVALDPLRRGARVSAETSQRFACDASRVDTHDHARVTASTLLSRPRVAPPHCQTSSCWVVVTIVRFTPRLGDRRPPSAGQVELVARAMLVRQLSI